MSPAPSAAHVGPGAQRTRGPRTQTLALFVLRLCLGVFMVSFGIERVSWLIDAAPLTRQLAEWAADAPQVSRWYLERVIPGAPVLARIIPAGSIVAGVALVAGFWTRIFAGVALVMILSLQIAAGAMFRVSYLRDPSGLPLVGGLVSLFIAGDRTRASRL